MPTFRGCVYACCEPQRSAHLYLPVLDYKSRTPCLALVSGSYVFLYWQRFLYNPNIYIFDVLRCIFTFTFENVIHEHTTSCLPCVYSLFHVLHHLSNSQIFVFIFLYLYIFLFHTHIYTHVHMHTCNTIQPVESIQDCCVFVCLFVIG